MNFFSSEVELVGPKAVRYADVLVAEGIGGANRLTAMLLHKASFLVDKGFDDDDAEDIAAALRRLAGSAVGGGGESKASSSADTTIAPTEDLTTVFTSVAVASSTSAPVAASAASAVDVEDAALSSSLASDLYVQTRLGNSAAFEDLRAASLSGDKLSSCYLLVTYLYADKFKDRAEAQRLAHELVPWLQETTTRTANKYVQYILAVCYYEGLGALAVNKTEAFKLFEMSANQGYVAAQYNLGYCYYNGAGVAKDEVEAVRWYRLAAEQGHAAAQYNLGGCYDDGAGVAKDEVEAVRWWRMAADQGLADAQYWLGTMYCLGRGVAKERVEGERLKTLARSNGY